MRKPIAALILATLATITTAMLPSSLLFHPYMASAATKDQPIQLVINGEVQALTQPLRMFDDIPYAPAQLFFEKLGYTVSWDESASTLTASKLGKTVTHTSGTDVLLVDRLVVRISQFSKLWEGSAWVPVRAVSEALGLEVKWNALTQTLFVKSGVTSSIADTLSLDGSRLTYEGASKDGMRDGQGKLYVDGVLWYEGSFSRNRLEGSGSLYDKEKLLYEGAFKDNKPDGYGVVHLSSGNTYGGEFKAGQQTGDGTRYANGQILYSGQWINGVMDGLGKQYDEQGKLAYSGSMLHNQRSGYGTSYGKDGKKQYDGEWSQGIREGRGRTFDSSGKLNFEGNWKNNKLDGAGHTVSIGSLEWVFTDEEKLVRTESRESVAMTEVNYLNGILVSQSRNLIYFGEKTMEGVPHGKGTLALMKEKKATQSGVIDQYKTIYEGDFKLGVRHGKGKMYNDSGQLVYDGELKDGIREGYGQTLEKGLVTYEGTWFHDHEQGTGRRYQYETHVNPDFDGLTVTWSYEGTYDQGKLVSAEKIYKYSAPMTKGRFEGIGYMILMYDPDSASKPTLPLADSAEGMLVYQGVFKDGYREGQGLLYINTRLAYKGLFVKGLPEDIVGREYYLETTYVGPFVKGEKNGLGTIINGIDDILAVDSTGNNKILFEGLFKNNYKNGFGREYTTDGYLYYEGEFRNDKKEGYGKLFYADGTLYYQGTFREDVTLDQYLREHR